MKGNVHIDTVIPAFEITSAAKYLAVHDGLSQEEIDNVIDGMPELYQKLTQVLAVKHSISLLRRTGGLCQSLTDSLIILGIELERELKAKYNYDFDDVWLDAYGR